MVWGYGVKTLSIKQPWAELILENKKTIEIRSWSTKFRGYFLIHSSKQVDEGAIKIFNFDINKLLRGYILGYAKLVDVIKYNSKDKFIEDYNKHLSINVRKFPVYGFVLENIHRINPIKYKGKLRFFDVNDIDIKINFSSFP